MRTINPKDLKKDLNNYNLALLFNRHRAREIRRQAAERIHQFANQELWLEEKNCELMYSYIKAFGYLGHRKVTKDAFNAFDCLSRIATYEHPKLSWRLKAQPYNIASFWSRNIARLLGRYDRIVYKAPDIQKESIETAIIDQEPVMIKELKRQKETALQQKEAKPRISAKERRQKIKNLRKAQLKQQKQKLIARQKAEKARARQKKAAVAALAISTLTSRPVIARPAPSIHKHKKAGFFKRNKDKVINGILGVAAFIGSVAGISVICDEVKQIKTNQQNQNAKDKIENIAQTKQQSDIKPIMLPSPSPVYKNYYDSALKIHLGEDGRDRLYDNLRNMAITQKLSIPEGESIEHLAHVITVSNLVQPNSATNQFLQECLQSKDALSGAAQNKLWHIVENAGDRAQNIKGTSTYSNFAKQSRQVQQQHLQALQNLRQATR